jgi:hypothetical protein
MWRSVAHAQTRTVVLMRAFRVVVVRTPAVVAAEASSSNVVESQGPVRSRLRAVVRAPRVRLHEGVQNETGGHSWLKTRSRRRHVITSNHPRLILPLNIGMGAFSRRWAPPPPHRLLTPVSQDVSLFAEKPP